MLRRAALAGALIASVSCNRSEGGDGAGSALMASAGSAKASPGGSFSTDLAKELAGPAKGSPPGAAGSGSAVSPAGESGSGGAVASEPRAADPAASGDKASGDKTNPVASGDKASGDKASGDKASGDKASGDKASGDKASGDKASGDKASGDKASGDKASGDKANPVASGDKASGDKASGDKASGDKAAGSAQPAPPAAARDTRPASADPAPADRAGAPAAAAGAQPAAESSAQVVGAPARGPVKVSAELAAVKLSLLPNWDRDIGQAGTFQYVVRIKGTQNTKTFTFRYGYDDPRAPADHEQYKKYLQDTRALTGEIRDRQRGAAWFLEGSDAAGMPAFRYVVLYGGKRLICYGSLYKDADSSRLGDDRDQTLIQAKQICETLAL